MLACIPIFNTQTALKQINFQKPIKKTSNFYLFARYETYRISAYLQCFRAQIRELSFFSRTPHPKTWVFVHLRELLQDPPNRNWNYIVQLRSSSRETHRLPSLQFVCVIYIKEGCERTTCPLVARPHLLLPPVGSQWHVKGESLVTSVLDLQYSRVGWYKIKTRSCGR